MSYWFLPFTFQLVLQSLILFPFALIFGKPVGFQEGVLKMRWWDWWGSRWNFTTSLGFIVGGSSRSLMDPGTWFHEVGVHVKQYEDLAVLSDVIALGVYFSTGNWIVALVIWGTGGPLWLLPNFLTALRYRKAWKALGWKAWRGLYMFSDHELDAYARTAQWKRNGGGR